MPGINYRDLVAGEATCEVTYNGHTLTLTYDPGQVTESALRDVARLARSVETVSQVDASSLAAAGANGGAQEMARALAALDDATSVLSAVSMLLCRFLTRWEVLDADGAHMFPITMERLADLPLPFLQACLNAIFGAGRLGEAKGALSSGRSGATTSRGARGTSKR